MCGLIQSSFATVPLMVWADHFNTAGIEQSVMPGRRFGVI
jgi:hypothetical protein